MFQSNRTLLTILAIIFVIPVIFMDTLLQMVQTWNADNTYTHGFFIFPISIWLIWKKRNILSQLPIQPEPKILILLILLSLGWVISNTVAVQIVQQFIMVSIIIILAWSILGRSVIRNIAFPLLFLYLAIPFGKSLIPFLMEFTADFTILLINILGIPVYREGLFFSLPTGNWSVIDACSGLNYFIASITLGLLYSYLTYSSNFKRFLFVLIIMATSIFANGFRAFGIVMIGHFSNMEYGTGGDHTFYGWIFYGLIVFTLFYLGSFWADPVSDDSINPTTINSTSKTLISRLQIGIIFIGLFITLSSVQYSRYLETSKLFTPQKTEFGLPQNFAGWQNSKVIDLDWEPTLKNPDLNFSQTYHYGKEKIKLSIGHFFAQRKNAEAVSSSNTISNSESGQWKKLKSVDLNIESHYVRETELQYGNSKLLVWNWYRMGSQDTPSPYIAKVFEAYNLIVLNRTEATIFAIATPMNNDKEYARQLLRQFWLEAKEDINTLLYSLSIKSKNQSN